MCDLPTDILLCSVIVGRAYPSEPKSGTPARTEFVNDFVATIREDITDVHGVISSRTILLEVFAVVELQLPEFAVVYLGCVHHGGGKLDPRV